MRRDKRNDYGKEGFMIKKYVEKRYILLPVEGGAQTTKIRFYKGCAGRGGKGGRYHAC